MLLFLLGLPALLFTGQSIYYCRVRETFKITLSVATNLAANAIYDLLVVAQKLVLHLLRQFLCLLVFIFPFKHL